jgi:hypothetical protein
MKTHILHLDSSEDSPSVVSIRPLEEFALPFSFDPTVYCTHAFYNSVLSALEDPIEGGCCPREVLKLLTSITGEARALDASGCKRKPIRFEVRPGIHLGIIAGLLTPYGITILAAPTEETAMAEIGLVDA